jgi:hypothetical protein
MMKHTVLSLLLSLVLTGCPQNLSVQPSPANSEITDAEYAALSVIVEPVIGRSPQPVFVLSDSTRGAIGDGTTWERIDTALTYILTVISRESPDIKTETMLDFKEKNLAHFYISRPAAVHRNCVLQSATQQRVPWLEISRVCFSPDNLQALAYGGYVDGPLVDIGYYYLLSRRSSTGKWSVVGTFVAWIS